MYSQRSERACYATKQEKKMVNRLLSPRLLRRRSIALISLLSVLSLSSPAIPLSAATIPDAGSILRDQQKSMQQPNELRLREEEQPEPAKAGEGVGVEVKQFTFRGYEGVATEVELQTLVADARGKTLTIGGIQALAYKITVHFRSKGWSQVRAFIPAQDITSGTVQIEIIQLKSDGHAAIKRDKTVRINDSILRRFIEPSVRPDQATNEHDLERSLLLLNDLPGLSTRASFVPGSASGTSSVEVTVTEGPLFSGTIWADNQGNRYTGAWRGNAMLSLNDPLHRGDQLSLLFTAASGLTQGRVGYSLPIAANGLRANLAWTGMRYELGEELASLQYKGSSNSIDAGFSYPVLRTRNANLTTSLSYGYRALVDTKSGIDIRDKQINNATLMLSGDRYDKFFGGGYSSYNAALTIGSLHEDVADISLTGAEGGYTRINLGLGRLQRLGDRLNINIAGSTQFALGNLDSSEKLSLGGPNGVRAYPIGEASGDEGQLLNADLRYTLPIAAAKGSLQLSLFYDAGHIIINKERYAGDLSSATNRNDYWLQGFGVGLNYSWSATASLRATWSHVIGDNAGRSIAGTNADGLNDKSRYWLQAIYSF
jgi:hemolysin activation/secretion protein